MVTFPPRTPFIPRMAYKDTDHHSHKLERPKIHYRTIETRSRRHSWSWDSGFQHHSALRIPLRLWQRRSVARILPRPGSSINNFRQRIPVHLEDRTLVTVLEVNRHTVIRRLESGSVIHVELPHALLGCSSREATSKLSPVMRTDHLSPHLTRCRDNVEDLTQSTAAQAKGSSR